MTNERGRPRKTLNDLPDGWQIRLREMGQEGMHDIDAIVYLGISKETFYDFLNDFPEFTDTIQEMRNLSHTWWASIPRKGFKEGKSKDLNSNLWNLVMRNKFKDEWNAEKKVDITTGGDKIDGNKKIEIEIIKSKIDNGESI
jgi:hypothetical protein